MAQATARFAPREPSVPTTPARARRVELTEENVRKIFGMSMAELFKKLAEKFGYQIED